MSTCCYERERPQACGRPQPRAVAYNEHIERTGPDKLLVPPNRSAASAEGSIWVRATQGGDPKSLRPPAYRWPVELTATEKPDGKGIRRGRRASPRVGGWCPLPILSSATEARRASALAEWITEPARGNPALVSFCLPNDPHQPLVG